MIGTMSNKRLSLKNTEHLVLGALMSNLDFLNSPLVKLEIDDFYSIENKIMFSILADLSTEGNDQVDPEHLYILMQDHSQSDRISSLFDVSVVKSLKERARLINQQTLSSDVGKLNKLNALRKLHSKGINVDVFFESKSVRSESLAQTLDRYSLEDIFNHFKIIVGDVEDELAAERTKTYSEAGEDIRELYAELLTTPQVGTLLEGEILNSVTRGARFGKLYLNSALSGGGKSRTMVGNAAALSMPYIDSEGTVVYKKEGYEKVLFVSTEQDITEIKEMLIARVSGVDEEEIKSGARYLDEESKRRVALALDIIELYSDNLHLEQIADPNLSIIKNKLVKHINKHKVQYIFYDYIFGSPSLTYEFAGTNVREDVALMYVANTLKEIATSYDVFIMTGTQLNSEAYKPVAVRGISMLRGSKAIADKVDVGSISTRLSDEEKMNVIDIINSLGCKEPNIVIDIYKNRAGSLTEIKIFRYFDYATCRTEDLFLTTSTYKLIPNYRVYEEELYKEETVRRETQDELNGA